MTVVAFNPLHSYMQAQTPKDALAFIAALPADQKDKLDIARSSDGKSALHIAILRGWHDVVKALVIKGADTAAAGQDGRTPLHEAVYCHNAPAIDILLAAGVDIEIRNRVSGDTPLHQAVRANSALAVGYLLGKGACAEAEVLEHDTLGKNACHLAAVATPDVLAVMLKNAPAELFAREYVQSKHAYDALRLAITQDAAPQAGMLADHGLMMNTHDAHGETVLHFLIKNRGSALGGLAVMEQLYMRGADVRAQTRAGGVTLLMEAAGAGYTDAFFFLLSRGADPLAVSRAGETALHFAAKAHNNIMTAALIDAGVPLDAQNNTGRTALHVAAHGNRKGNVDFLLAGGANPLITDKHGNTAAQICQGPLQTAVHATVVQGEAAWRAQHPQTGIRRPGGVQRKWPAPRPWKK